MAFSISPGITFREIDLTGSTSYQPSSLGAFAGKFTWGEINKNILINDEAHLVSTFGVPVSASAVDFLTASSFLSYTSGMNCVRIGNASQCKNAVSSGTAVAILNDDSYTQTASNISTIAWVGKYAGALGNSIAVSTCDSANRYSQTLPGAFTFPTSPRSKVVTYTPSASEVLSDYFNVGDFLTVDGVRYQVAALTGTSLTLDRIYAGVSSPTTKVREWQYASATGYSPATNTIHVVVIDEDGLFTKEAGTILEVFQSVSTVAGTLNEDGTSNYYIDVINTLSKYIRVGGASISGINTGNKSVKYSLTGGADGFSSLTTEDYLTGYSLFLNKDTVDAPLIIGGEAITSTSSVLANFLIQNIAEVRKNSIAFISPALASVLNNTNGEVTAIRADRQSVQSSSYGHMDSNWKYMYDRYNGVYRWVPLNGDCAGIYARTHRDFEQWYSGAGTTRGIIKNYVKLAFNPFQAERDALYQNDVNPVFILPDTGAVLFGDKTMVGRNSAFSRMNVRSLFILLEEVITKASRDLLFEFNNEFTQRRFVNLVTPFLRTVKGKQGIIDFRVVCDQTNNTTDVVDANRFVGQVFVKPARSINFIRLDFVAVDTATSFDTVVGTV